MQPFRVASEGKSSSGMDILSSSWSFRAKFRKSTESKSNWSRNLLSGSRFSISAPGAVCLRARKTTSCIAASSIIDPIEDFHAEVEKAGPLSISLAFCLPAVKHKARPVRGKIADRAPISCGQTTWLKRCSRAIEIEGAQCATVYSLHL